MTLFIVRLRRALPDDLVEAGDRVVYMHPHREHCFVDDTDTPIEPAELVELAFGCDRVVVW